MLTLSQPDFLRLVKFIKSNYGINLEQKKQLIVGRLTPIIMAKGFTSFSDYIDLIINKRQPADIEVMLNALTTNYTYFMREVAHFDYFQHTVLPWLEATKHDKVLSIWCAGCSTGQEPYTLSMILKDYFSKKGNWDTRILATDISQKALGIAQAGTYPIDTLEGLPKEWVSRYFKKTSALDKMAVTDEIKSNVIFRTFNLMDDINFKLKFDVIFCRNVMIYFDHQTKTDMIKRFYNSTVSGGFLFVGHSEALPNDTGYTYVKPATYRK